MKLLNDIFNKLSWILIILLWIFSIYCYIIFPDNIPTHFNFRGEPDNYSNKASLFILAIIGTFVFSVLSFARKFPQHQSSNSSKHQNGQLQLHEVFLNYLRCFIMFLFIYIIFSTHQIVIHQASGLSSWFMPILIFFIFGPTIFYLYKTIKSK